MTDDNGADVSRLPTPKFRPPSVHALGDEVMIAADISPSGYEQKEKTCKNCGAVRVTMIGAPFPRAWRLRGSEAQILGEPLCR